MGKWFKRLGLTVFGATVVFWALTRPSSHGPVELPEHRPDTVNGELQFHAGGCASCHGSSLEGGLEMDTAFGVFRVPNISPDPETGIGGWTTTQFVDAMSRGVSPDGRHYYPSFPYTSYARMKIGDIIDLKAYLDAIEPVRNRVADHEIAFPWNLRRGIGLWKRLYLDSGPVVEAAPSDALFERGRYIVESMGHCAECHTPRDRFGGLDEARWLAGADSLDGDGTVPNITPHVDGLASWSEEDIAYYLESGFLPDFDMVGGAMVEVQENLAHLPDSDRSAIAAYLKRIPALPGPPE
jgi:mono/diheme cytochrome c family protein